MRGVDPAVETPAKVVDDGVRVERTKARVQPGSLVGNLVAVGVLEIPDIRRRRRDDAGLVEDKTGHELELVGEHVLPIHQAIAIRVRQNRDGVLGIACLTGRPERPRIPPWRHVQHAPAVRILRGLRDPQPALLVPVDVHRLGDERLGGHERQIELRMNFDLCRSLAGRGRPAFRVAQRVPEFILLHELVNVRALACPGDPAEQDRAVVRAIEVLVQVAGNRHERSIGHATAIDGSLVGPHLRLDIVDADFLAAASELVRPALEVGVARAG